MECQRRSYAAPISGGTVGGAAERRSRPGPLRLAYLAMVEGKVRKVLEGHRASQAPDEAAVAHLSEVLTGLSEMRKELET